MSAETAAGWNDNLLLDRWHSAHSCSPAGRISENHQTESEGGMPSTPLFRPRSSLLPISSPSPLSLPPAMRFSNSNSPLKSQTLLEAFVRCCSCRDFDSPSCSCVPATTPCPSVQRSTPRSPLAELKTDMNVFLPSDLDNSPSKCKSFKSTPQKRRSNSISPSPKAASPLATTPSSTRGRGLSRSKRSYSESGSENPSTPSEIFSLANENTEVASQHTADVATVATVVSPFKRKRPPKLQIPSTESDAAAQAARPNKKDVPLEVSVEGKSYGIYSRKGHRDVLEDTYQAVPDMDGNTQQAFFGIFDGHGGRVAAEFVADNLSRNICDALSNGQRDVEDAVRLGYLQTDAAFLEKRVSSGASCVTAFVTDGELVVANAGDCRAVMSRNGSAVALTEDHRLTREDERRRVEDLGAYVDCFSGVWRLQGVLAVSRGIGDLHLKEWVSAEPEIHKLTIDSDCEFLLLASDGLWDVVSNQEAVDCITRSGKSAGGLAAASKKLVQLAASRGSQDDISVMVVNLKHFYRPACSD